MRILDHPFIFLVSVSPSFSLCNTCDFLLTGLESESRHIFESKLRDVCDDLLGPVYKTKGKSSWDPLILVTIQILYIVFFHSLLYGERTCMLYQMKRYHLLLGNLYRILNVHVLHLSRRFMHYCFI